MAKPKGVTEVINYYWISERLGTGGQPTPPQIEALAAAGYRLVINLAKPDSPRALPNEGALVTGAGMDYVHLPVEWEAPTAERFKRFRTVLRLYRDLPVFAHCAMNMRVSAFVYLYRVIELGVPLADAESDVHSIWTPNPVWTHFIERILAAEGAVSRE